MVQVSGTSHLVNSNGPKSPVKIWLFETNHQIAGPLLSKNNNATILHWTIECQATSPLVAGSYWDLQIS